MKNPWFPFTQPAPEQPLRLFCLPYSGGGALAFRHWCGETPEQLAVIPVQLPGRENRLLETPAPCLERLLELLFEQLQPYLERPFALFGHSMGALIAFELLRLLRRRQAPSALHLFVSGFRSPEFPRRRCAIHQLPDVEFLEELRRYGGTPEQIFAHQELLMLLLPALRADFALHESYRYHPEPPLECPISVFGGTEDTLVNQTELLGWRAHTRAHFRVHMLPGDHFFLNTARPLLLAAIQADLKI